MKKITQTVTSIGVGLAMLSGLVVANPTLGEMFLPTVFGEDTTPATASQPATVSQTTPGAKPAPTSVSRPATRGKGRPSDVCQDPDGGLNLRKKATTKLYYDASSARTDYCEKQTVIVEYVCDNDQVVAVTKMCPKGTSCVDGACVQ